MQYHALNTRHALDQLEPFAKCVHTVEASSPNSTLKGWVALFLIGRVRRTRCGTSMKKICLSRDRPGVVCGLFWRKPRRSVGQLRGATRAPAGAKVEVRVVGHGADHLPSVLRF